MNLTKSVGIVCVHTRINILFASLRYLLFRNFYFALHNFEINAESHFVEIRLKQHNFFYVPVLTVKPSGCFILLLAVTIKITTTSWHSG